MPFQDYFQAALVQVGLCTEPASGAGAFQRSTNWPLPPPIPILPLMRLPLAHSGLLLHALVSCISLLTLCMATPSGSAESTATAPTTDPYLWLEDVTGSNALTWVREQNAVSTNELEAAPEFEKIRTRLLSIMDSKERIPYVGKHGAWYYNFWRDQKTARPLAPDHSGGIPQTSTVWETVLDLDQLAARKSRTGFGMAQTSLPDYDRCLVFLSHGGARCDVVREFDLTTKSSSRRF